MINEVIRYSGHCDYCGRNLYPVVYQERAERELCEHMDKCEMNPKNKSCATCAYWHIAQVFELNEEAFEYGCMDERKANLEYRMCDYVDGLVSKKTTGCIYWGNDCREAFDKNMRPVIKKMYHKIAEE